MKQTITWLFGNQVTEELAHCDDDSKGSPGDDLQKHFLPAYYPTLSTSTQSSLPAGPVIAEDLTGRHADDIPTPPPNC